MEGVNTERQGKKARKAEENIAEEVEDFSHWLSSLDVVPTITALRQMAERIKEGELEKALSRFDAELTESDRNRIEAMASGIVNKMLHAPTVELKRAANERGGYLYVESMRRLFKLNGNKRKERQKHEHLED